VFDKKEYNKQYNERNKEKISEYYKNNTLEYIWRGVKRRCYNPRAINYKNYGGRGIVMCDEWLNSYENFKEWCLSSGYKPELEIDRIDNNGNYCPSNCQFITSAENLAVGKQRKRADNTSGYTGVFFHKSTGKYQARITINKKSIFLGYFTTPELALQARINAEIKYFGEQKTNLGVKI
jgi:hypothetical protein